MKTKTILPLLLCSLAGTSFAQVPTVINVEVDYMEDQAHSHRPSQNVVDALVAMFACHGITLNMFLDTAIPHVPVIQCDDPVAEDFWSCGGPTSFATMKANYSLSAGVAGWHYAIMGHSYNSGSGTGSSGRGQSCGGDFIVTLGGLSESDFQVASTFAHELGHTLGLSHTTAASTATSGNYSANYASVMSYRYQLAGIRTAMECSGLVGDAHLFKDIDYSNGRLPTIIETSLDESAGIGIHAVDWNCDGTLTPGNVWSNIDDDSDWCVGPLGFSTLVDQNDWAMLCDDTEQPDASLDLGDTSEECLPKWEWGEWGRAEGLPDPSLCANLHPDTGPTLTFESCQTGEMVFVDRTAGVFQLGTGDRPYRTLTTAVSTSSPGSVLYLQSGNFNFETLPLVITKPLILTGPGGAVVSP